MPEHFQGPVVSADHPSLDDAVDRFARRVRAETRSFGPRSSANPKPLPSLLEAVCRRGEGIAVAALDGAEVVGLARIDARGEVHIVVDPARRGTGVGTCMASELVRRARIAGLTRLVLRSSRRSRAASGLGRTLGFAVVDRGLGRLDLILDLDPATGRTA